MWRRLKAVLVGAFSILCVLGAGRSEATCLDYPNVADEFARSEFVYVAFVQAATVVPADAGDWFDAVEYTVTPLDVFKGVPPASLTLWSENSTGRFPMRPTGTYLIFVPPEHGVGWHGELQGRSIDNCGNSFEMSALSLAIAPPVSEGSLDAALLRDPDLVSLENRSRDCLMLRRATIAPPDAGHAAQVERGLRCDSLDEDAAWLTRRYEGYPAAIEAVSNLDLE